MAGRLSAAFADIARVFLLFVAGCVLCRALEVELNLDALVCFVCVVCGVVCVCVCY